MEIFIIVVVVIVAVFIWSKKESAHKSVSSENAKLTFSDDYRTEAGHITVSSTKDNCHHEEVDNHDIAIFYCYQEKMSVWICPNCEAENELSITSCCVCGHTK